ncbi:MAG: phosphodiester glycosidase family protein [Acidobacteria bacterium]|nr:phosphodiester glycosidase family protein [Acidobacteriota bacterium]MCA1650734.1 phosphodiester glycosidase family protein [Acidobacteriota bacterium]
MRFCGSASVTLCALLLLARPSAQRLDPGPPAAIAPGVDLYHLTDPSLIDPAGPISAWLLRLDPALIDLKSVLANDEILGLETVSDMGERHRAVAAINAGFFLPNGDPSGVLKINGQLVSDTHRPRGAVGIVPLPHGPMLVYGHLRASVSVSYMPDGRTHQVQIDGVDTVRRLGKVMLYTPEWYRDTTTPAGGVEWVLVGSPLAVTGPARRGGATVIPRGGCVLSFGGRAPPVALRGLRPGVRVTLKTVYRSIDGAQSPWDTARDIIGGAGLLVRDGRPIEDWSVEQFGPRFADARHPRTMIGTDASAAIWLVVVDGRQPALSLGMTLVELRRLAERLQLTNALNLDGGGSTTMWVAGRVVNSPSDADGPRKVSDALLVHRRPPVAPYPASAGPK